MAKLKISNDWWTAPAESESGNLILVTGRRGMEHIIATGVFRTAGGKTDGADPEND